MNTRSWLGKAGLALALLVAVGGFAASAYMSENSPREIPAPGAVTAGDSGYVLTGADFPAAAAETGNKVGYQVPDFTLELVDGSAVTSASLVESGQPTFLFFWATI